MVAAESVKDANFFLAFKYLLSFYRITIYIYLRSFYHRIAKSVVFYFNYPLYIFKANSNLTKIKDATYILF